MPAGKLGFRSGPLMAAVDQIQVTLYGKGGHGAQPHETVDPIVMGASYVLALQSIVSRNVDPLEASVVTVGCLKSGAVCNIIPESAFLDIGYRHFKPEIGAHIGRRIAELAEGTAKAYGGRAEVTVVRGYPVLVNEAEQTRFAKQVGAELFGEDRVYDIDKPFLGSEDFSYMLQQRPGTYLMIGNGESASLHNPRYNFNDAILTTGAAYWTGLVERYLRP
jgi:hippurate hydrolase